MLLDGNATDAWSYDEMTGNLTVRVPKTRCDAPVKIEVIRDAASAAAKKADNTIDLYYDVRADELVASMARKVRNLRLQVLSVDGREAAKFAAADADRMVCNLGQLPQGGYVCRLNADGQVVTRKFVK